MDKEYSYPIDVDWSTEEVIHVVQFYEAVEAGYNGGIAKEILDERYKVFKTIVPSKAEEKTQFKEFEASSGYAPYPLIKQSNDKASGETVSK